MRIAVFRTTFVSGNCLTVNVHRAGELVDIGVGHGVASSNFDWLFDLELV